MSKSFIFSSESATEGHPDKVSDTISDAILDECLTQDENSRVACETMVKDNIVVLAGEIRTKADLNYTNIVKSTIEEIGYTNKDCKFNSHDFCLLNMIGDQSEDISKGVDSINQNNKVMKEQGAGDQGIMFGYAVKETPELMPSPIAFAHKLSKGVANLRKSGKYDWLRPDAKTQVSMKYENGKPVSITDILISSQHSSDIDIEDMRKILKEDLIKKEIPNNLLTKDTNYHVNPMGIFIIGGPEGDCGLTGRKIIIDTYGGIGRHGGGAFSGKDPSKVDRSAAYMARHVAKNIVSAGLAYRCEIQLSYAIGSPDPVSIYVNTFGTGKVDDEKISNTVKKVFPFKPSDFISYLQLIRPIYKKTTNYGHFGKEDDKSFLTWEKTDKVEELLSICL